MAKTTGKIKGSNSFGVFIQRQLSKDFKDEDLETGYMKINNVSFGGTVWFRRPPKEFKVVGVFKTRDFTLLEQFTGDNTLLEKLPALLYYTME